MEFEINRTSPIALRKCEHCECVFMNMEQLNGHNREIHSKQLAVKRKMECCDDNQKKRKVYYLHDCHYCECKFQRKSHRDYHVNSVHKCLKCSVVMLTDDVRTQHTKRHDQEAQLEELQKLRQQQMDDDFVLIHLKGRQLDKYQPQPDYEPDFDYIFGNYRFEKDDLVRFVKKFKREYLDYYLGENYEDADSAKVIYLAEKGVLSTKDVADFICTVENEYVPEYLPYLLDKGYKIEPYIVVKVIDNDELMERIKETQTFTFDEIYEKREFGGFFTKQRLDRFYVQLHKYFPDPDFEDPYADPYEDFKCVQTNHVEDHLFSRYYYDSDEDELSIVVGDADKQRKISLGSCAEMLKESLDALIKRYEEEKKLYDELNEKVSTLFEQREDELDKATSRNDRENILDIYHDEIYGEALPERNHQASIVSKLYFVISMK